MEKNVLIIVISLLLISICNPYAAQAKIDSLKSVVKAGKTTSEKLDAAIKLSKILLKSRNSETKKYLDIANRLLNENPDSLSLAKVTRMYALYDVYSGDYEEAAHYYLTAVEISKKIKNTELTNYALNGLAQLNLRTKNYSKAESIFKYLIAQAKQANNDDDILIYSLNLATTYGEDGNFDESEKYLLEVYKSNPKNKFFKAVAANSLSFIYNNQGKYNKALKYGKEAAEYSQNVSDEAFKIESLTNYSNSLKGLGENVKAGKIIKEIISMARSNHFIRKMNNSIGNLALNYEAMQDFKSAYKYYKDFSERRDSLLTEATTAKINELQIKYETAKKDHEIQEKTDALRRRNSALIFSVSGVILFIAISILIFILYRKKNEAYKEIVKKNIELINTEEQLLKKKQNELKQEKYVSSALSDEKKDKLHLKLIEAISEEKIFLNPDITLGKLAQRFGINSKYLSQVIHEFYNSGFSDFINQLRIKEAARLLSDQSYSHISIEGISEMVGFNTKSSFNIYFKKFIGVTPSYFSSTSKDIL